jgi:polyphosphate kinase
VSDGEIEALLQDEATAGLGPQPDLDDPSLYVNRELSWLDFNDRVLQLAEDPELELFERVKFLAIFTSNLDEFFMVRVAGVHDQIEARIDARGPDGLSPPETLEEISEKVRELDARHSHTFERVVRPELAEDGIRIISCAEADAPEDVARHFREQIFPVLTPLAIGPGRPFPYISNLSLSLLVQLRDPNTDTEAFARVKVPKEVLPRFVEISKNTFVPIEDVIATHLDELFLGMEVISHHLFRVTRDADFDVADGADDLLAAVEDELRRRRFGEVVRLEVDAAIDAEARARLVDWLAIDPGQVYDVEGLLDLTDLWQIAGIEGHPELRQPPWTPLTHPAFRPRSTDADEDQPDIFSPMRAGDILVHYPYQSFSSSVERFVTQAAEDDNVLAIKMTVYRTSGDSLLVPALIAAAERGKQAVCMVELKARFDERRNIRWSRELEEVGAHVVHGIPGLKTHAKVILVVRREGGRVRHYVMIGTGNFHAKNARLYEDFGLFTTDPEIGQEVANLFNTLTGYAHPKRQREVLVAPDHMRGPLLEQIERTTQAHRDGKPARIALKMNSLVDRRCIEALYAASAAGVPIDLNVRGICCLRPGVPGVSDTINVVSVVGRFLEHSRIYSFHSGDEHVVYIGSADLMPRNLDTRVELLTPVLRPELQAELADTLERCLADDTNAWTMEMDGTWHRREGKTRSVHRELMERTVAQVSASATVA